MSSKPPCKYGAACYRKSLEHLKSYDHPSGEQEEEENNSSPPPQKKQKISNDLPSTDDSTPQQVTQKKAEPLNKKIKEQDVATSKANVRSQFLVDMPEEFYLFWDFCKSLDSESPATALRDTLNLDLTGPYDILSGALKGMASDRCVLHGRHYYDPPEMVTVLTQHNTGAQHKAGFHIGYFRDDPKSDQYWLVSNDSSKGYAMVIEASNIFSAVWLQVEDKLKGQDKTSRSSLEKLAAKLESFLSSHKNIPQVDVKALKKKRASAVVGQTLHGMGIIVPYDKKTELGYRPVPFTKRELKKILQNISNQEGNESAQEKLFDPIHEVVTFVQFANDECDYGMGLELGVDLFSHGDPFLHSVVRHLMPVAYELLQREEFGQICRLHLDNRGKDPMDASKQE